LGNIIIYNLKFEWAVQTSHLPQQAGRYYAQSACSDQQRQADQQAVATMGDGRTADAGAG